MRIISQSGTCDMPYEKVVLTIGKDDDCYRIYAGTIHEGEEWILASYTTKKQAMKVFNDMSFAYKHGEKVFKFESEITEISDR